MVEVNLIPESVLFARTCRRHAVRWATSLALAGTTLALCAGSDWVQRVEVRSLRDKRERLGAEMVRASAELDAVTLAANDAHLRVERARALRSKRAWSGMLALIASRMPEGSWLTSIATDPSSPPGGAGLRPRATATGKTNQQAGLTGSDESVTKIEGPQRLKIVGYASDASEPYQFVTNLKNTNVFRDVVLETSRRERVQDQQAGFASAWYFRFDLACEW